MIKSKPTIKTKIPVVVSESVDVKVKANLNLTLNIGDFTQMIHLSDIHIRPLQRHDEYKDVFKEALRDITKLSREQSSVIVVTGDIFDHKTVFRPETFKMCRDFLKQLGQISPVILIAGNHDMMEQNTTARLDSLTPVVDDIPGVNYLKHSGIYNITSSNTSFVVSSLYDKQFIPCPTDTDTKERTYICLYHGDITGSYGTSEDTVAITTRNRTKEDFNGFHAVLLGDIHKHQLFQNDRGSYMAYPGSLIQQNHGEPLEGHGFLVWKKNAGTWGEPRHYSVKNDYGFIDIHCSQGEWIDRPMNGLPRHCYARLLIRDCTQTQLDLICSEVRRVVPEDGSLIITKKHAVSTNRDEETATEQAPDQKRKEDEMELILEQAKEQGMDGPRLVQLHKEYQAQTNATGAIMSSAVWRPVWVEFKNLFGYGGGAVNYIRFKRGLTSITAGNACGKSSTVNALLFGIFGRVPLNPSSSSATYDVVNNRETGGYIKILLNHGGVYYLIERHSCKPKSKATAADLQKLTKHDFTCEIWESNLHGDKLVNRCDTRQNNNDTFIAELFGDLADFSLTNLLNKESSLDLLSMTPADQVKTLKSLFKMDIYDTYRDLNKKRLAELESNLTKLRVKAQSFQTLIDPNVTEDALTSLKDTVALKQGEEEEERELLEQKQHEYQELNSQLRLLESRSVEKLETLETLETLEELQEAFDELGHVDDPGTSIPGSDVLRVKIETTQAKIDRLKRELSGVSNLQNEDELKTLLDDLNVELKSFEDQGHNILPAATLNKKIGVIQAKLDELEDIPETRDIDVINSEITDLNLDTETDARSQLRDILHLKNRLTSRMEPKAGESVNIESLTAMLTPGIPTEFTAANEKQLISKITELEACSAELEEFQAIVITDTKNVIDQLCDCPLMDEKGSSKFGLTGEYRLVEDNLMERLIVHFENEQEHQKVIPIITKYETLKQHLEHLRAIKTNNDIQKQINWLTYEELKKKEEALGLLANLQEELRNAKMRSDMEDLKRQYEELNNMITYYEILEDIKTAKANLELHQQQKELQVLLKEQDVLEQQLQSQEAWERFNYLSDAIESYETVKEIESLRSEALRHQRQIPAMKGNLHATQRFLKQAEDQLARMELKLEQQTAYREEMETVQAELIKLELEVKPLTDYGVLMGSRGIASRMLFNKISSIQGYINDILNSFTRYNISIIFDDKKQTMSIVAEDKDSGRSLSTTRFSGYEKLMLQIALKRALNKYSYNSKSSLIIIDEALDCIDSVNFDTKLPDIMCLITQDYSTCLAISQRDISHVADVNMTIRREHGCSRLE